MKNIKTEIIRVRFRTQEAGLLVNGQTTLAKYGRPKRILKVTESTTFQVQNGNDSKEKTKEEVYYTSMIKGSKLRIDPTTFITEWEKGPTPTPRPLRKYNNEQLLAMNYTYEQIAEIRGREWRSKDIKALHSKVQLPYKKCKELLEEHGNLKTVLEFPEAKSLLVKKEQKKLYQKKQKPKVKRGSRETKRQMLDKLRRENLAKVKEIKRLARVEKEQLKVETT